MIVTDFAPNLDPANAEEVYYLSTLIFDMPAIKPDQTGFILVSLHYLSSSQHLEFFTWIFWIRSAALTIARRAFAVHW